MVGSDAIGQIVAKAAVEVHLMLKRYFVTLAFIEPIWVPDRMDWLSRQLYYYASTSHRLDHVAAYYGQCFSDQSLG